MTLTCHDPHMIQPSRPYRPPLPALARPRQPSRPPPHHSAPCGQVPTLPKDVMRKAFEELGALYLIYWRQDGSTPPAAYRLPPAAYRLPPAACRLPPAAYRFHLLSMLPSLLF